MWIFDCVIDEVHDLKRACFEPPFGGQGGYLYHIPRWIFDCVIDEVHDLKRACFEPAFGGLGGYLYRLPMGIFDCVLDWLNAGRCDKGF